MRGPDDGRVRRLLGALAAVALVLGLPLTWATTESAFSADTVNGSNTVTTASDYLAGSMRSFGGGHEYLPTLFDGATTWTAVSVSGDHACGIKSSDTLWCWGTQTRLGLGITGTVVAPTQVTTPSATGWNTVSAGTYHTCATRDDGTLYCWGRNSDGQLGLGSTTEYSTPQQVGAATTWTSVSGGSTHTCGLRGTAALYCWGDNTYGQVGNGTTGTDWTSPQLVALPAGTSSWVTAQTGTDYSCAMPDGGKIYCWGSGATGRLGTGSTANQNTPAPVVSPSTTGWSGLSTGHDFACALRSGSAYCWGYNGYGQFGSGTTTNNSTPQLNSGGSSWVAVVPGYHHTCGLKSGAPMTVWCWGDAAEGALGIGSPANDMELNPVQVTVPFTPTTKVFDGSATRMSYFIGSDGKLYGWGRFFEKVIVPTAVSGGYTDWKSPAAGERHYCGLRTGQLWCWGQNTDGRVGDGSTTRRTAPVRIGAFADWTALAAGARHTCGVRNAIAYCWGSNANGRAGANTATNQYLAPQTVAGGYTDWTALAAGYSHTCGLRAGQLWCWGANSNGQLGINSTTDAITPTRVGAASDWTVVSAGATHTCGIRSTGGGTLYCWGNGGDGRLGLGSTTQYLEPQALAGVWSTVSLGASTSCGIRTAGTLHCWGDNSLNQVGNGGVVATSPYQIGTDADWKTISGSLSSFCGTRNLRVVACWGEMRTGSGNGDVTTRDAPYVISGFLARPVVSGSTSRTYFAVE